MCGVSGHSGEDGRSGLRTWGGLVPEEDLTIFSSLTSHPHTHCHQMSLLIIIIDYLFIFWDVMWCDVPGHPDVQIFAGCGVSWYIINIKFPSASQRPSWPMIDHGGAIFVILWFMYFETLNQEWWGLVRDEDIQKVNNSLDDGTVFIV